MGGVTVGSGSIVGAGSVVIEDVPDRTIVAGNPAKVVRKLQAEKLGSQEAQSLKAFWPPRLLAS